MKTLDEYIDERNNIQLAAESFDKPTADKCWVELGVANRHINRVLLGMLPLAVVEKEIQDCLLRVRKLYERTTPNPRPVP